MTGRIHRRPRSSPGRPHPQNWRQRIGEARQTLSNIPAAFRLVLQADRKHTTVMAMITLVAAGLPLAQAYVAQQIVDKVVAVVQQGLRPTDRFGTDAPMAAE